MSAPGEGGATWVFHRGALGDSVLLWPLLRAKRREGQRVVLVADGSKAALAAAELRIEAVDAEQARFNRLWVDAPAQEVIEGAGKVLAWTGPGDPGESVWERNLRAMFPGADVAVNHERPDALLARQWTGRGGAADALVNPRGPVVLHVGAGSEQKRWPLERFAEVAASTRAAVIAGEAEAERFTPPERRLFAAIGGRLLTTLDELARELRSARLVIACDSGPAHLAAQLGVPTLALFGPTDPARWAPVGPRARALAPPEPSPMDCLTVERVHAEAHAMLAPP
ncbi:MAG: glycosyltransferase family 9 protein [Phycisphaerales bacterium]